MMIEEISSMTNNTTPPLSMLSFFARKRGDGYYSFTIFELITTIILTCALIASVFIVITQTKKMKAMYAVSAVDQVVAYIRYAQMRAMANRGTGANATVNIAFAEGSTDVYLCNNKTPCNRGVAFETLKLPVDTSVGTQTFTFNTLGELTGGTRTLSLGGVPKIKVYGITGKVEKL